MVIFWELIDSWAQCQILPKTKNLQTPVCSARLAHVGGLEASELEVSQGHYDATLPPWKLKLMGLSPMAFHWSLLVKAGLSWWKSSPWLPFHDLQMKSWRDADIIPHLWWQRTEARLHSPLLTRDKSCRKVATTQGEIMHHFGWFELLWKSGMLTTYQLVQDFAIGRTICKEA